MNGYSIPQKINVLGESWELIKNANDPSVGFPFERVNTVDFQCDEITRGLYRVMVTGNIQPINGSLEKPLRLVFIGFNNTPIYQRFLVRDHLRKMSIYKADMGNFAAEFTNAFLGNNKEAQQQYDIKPYPETKGENNGRTTTDDE